MSIMTNAENVSSAIKDERDRCEGIVQLARAGEIDQDFRTVIHFIQGGMSVEDVKKLGS